ATPLSRHSLDRSSESPSEMSIIAEAPRWARVWPSPTRATGRNCAARRSRPHADVSADPISLAGARESWNPPAAAPRDPVTTIPSPGLAPALVTAASFGTSPVTATATTTRSARTVSPPTTDTAYSAAASRMPPYSSTTHAASASGGRPSEIRPYRGLPPIAATSLTFTTTALYPRSRADMVDRSKCTPSTSMYAVSTALYNPMSTTAATSPQHTHEPVQLQDSR